METMQVGVSLDETVRESDIDDLLDVFQVASKAEQVPSITSFSNSALVENSFVR